MKTKTTAYGADISDADEFSLDEEKNADGAKKNGAKNIEANETDIKQNRSVNFVVVGVFLCFFVTMTRPLSLNLADDFFTSCKSQEARSADYDMPFVVERPPDGAGWLLRRSHLRWIIREEIRLTSMMPLINHENDRAMKEYIELLNDYNSVAKNAYCEITDMRAARIDIEPFREQISSAAAMEVEVNGWDK